MLSRRLGPIWLIACILLVSIASSYGVGQTAVSLHPSAPANDRKFVVTGLGSGTVSLDGPWQFQIGDDLKWAAPDFDDSGWRQLSADKPWGDQGYPSYTGYAWYRLRISLSTNSGDEPSLALLVPHLDDVYDIYWNGKSIGRSGKFPPYPTWYRSSDPPILYSLNSEAQIAMNSAPETPTHRVEGTLAIRVWKAPLLSDDSGRTGGFEGAPIVGTRSALAAYRGALDYHWLRAHEFSFNLNLLYGIVGMLSLIIWLRDRKQRPVLWMTGFALAPLVRLVLYGMRFAWPVGLSNALGEPVSSIRDICLWFLLLWLLHLDNDTALVRLTRRFAVISLSATLLDALTAIADASVHWYWLIQLADAIATVVYFITAALPLLLVAIAVTRNTQLDSARWMVAIAAFLSGMIQVTLGMAPQGSRFTHWTLADTLEAPMFLLNGNAVNLRALSGLLLLVAIVYAVYRISMENRRRQSMLEQEFSSARELQQVLIPETLPSVPGYAITSSYRPAQEVGGDFFQIIPLENEATLVIVGDVSGKGLKASMAVSLIVGMIRALIGSIGTPAELLTELNRCLCGRMQGGFTTCQVLRVEANGDCLLASAGHPAPYLNEIELDVPGSLPLGLSPTALYEQIALNLKVRDHLSLYTDGLLEARNKAGDLFGFDRIGRLFAARPAASKATEAAVAFGQDDDITVVILTRVPSGKESTTVHTIA
jgi:hypothetical protein